MADNLGARVAVLERDVAALKARTDPQDADLQTIPGLIQTQFQFVDSKFARVHAEFADLKVQLDDRFRQMDERFDAVLRAVAAIVAEGRSPG